MNAKTLRAAISEAERFLDVAKQLRSTIETRTAIGGQKYERMDTGTAISGSVRRASMDVTRAMAGLRRYS